MRDAIIEKLSAVLSGGIDSECKVVYVLAEARKLLERYPTDPTPFGLKLYCHWALHVDLDAKGTTLQFLKQVDDFVANYQDVVAGNRVFHQFLLDSFKEQLREFLEAYGLTTDLCDDDTRWQEFLKHYAGVIEDGTLSCQAKNQPLKHVSEVIFSKAKRSLADAEIPFYPAWRIVLLNGKSIIVDVKPGPLIGGKPSIAWGITLG